MNARWQPGSWRFGLAACVVSALAVLAYLRGQPGGLGLGVQVPVALGVGLCVTAAAFYAGLIADAVRERRLLRDAARGAPPVPGRRSAFVGRIESRETVQAPISGESVLAYRYWVSQSKMSAASTDTTFSTVYRGSALVPSTVVTPAGSFQLHCLPHFVSETPLSVAAHSPLPSRSTGVDSATAAQRFHAYASATRFEVVAALGVAELPDEHPPGTSRRADLRSAHVELDWKRASIIEQAVRSGEQVTVVASFDERGIVADPETGEPGWLYQGGSELVSRSLSTQLRQGMTGLLFFLALAAAAIVGYELYLGRAG